MNYFKYFLIILMLCIIENSQAGNPGNIHNPPKDTLKLPESITKEELESFKDHSNLYGHAGGPEFTKGMRARQKINEHYRNEIRRFSNEIDRGMKFKYNPKLLEQAWTLTLYKSGHITADQAKTVLLGLKKMKVGGEHNLRKYVDENHASIPYFGRTKHEPQPKYDIREKQLDVIDSIHSLQTTLLNAAEKHAKTIMPGMTHMAHAQPTTYGAYLLALHDQISRGLEYLELAYKHTNINNGGVGAMSGAGFYVDRDYMSEILGFDETIDLTYGAEPGQDYVISTLNALSNIMLSVGRTAMDHGIWGMETLGTHLLPAGASSFMPHKAHSGSEWEYIRINVNNVLAASNLGVLALNKEPIMDILTTYQAGYRSPNIGALGALIETEMTLGMLRYDIENIRVDKEKLLQQTIEGWGSITDLVTKLVFDEGYGVRQAHRICAVMVRIARIHRNNLKPYEITGKMLDEAALLTNDPEPNLTTEELQEILDPVKFIERHKYKGEPNPEETVRMVDERREQLRESEQQQKLRRGKVETGYKKLRDEIDKILE